MQSALGLVPEEIWFGLGMLMAALYLCVLWLSVLIYQSKKERFQAGQKRHMVPMEIDRWKQRQVGRINRIYGIASSADIKAVNNSTRLPRQ
jgi:hypothetical protein